MATVRTNPGLKSNSLKYKSTITTVHSNDVINCASQTALPFGRILALAVHDKIANNMQRQLISLFIPVSYFFSKNNRDKRKICPFRKSQQVTKTKSLVMLLVENVNSAQHATVVFSKSQQHKF